MWLVSQGDGKVAVNFEERKDGGGQLVCLFGEKVGIWMISMEFLKDSWEVYIVVCF